MLNLKNTLLISLLILSATQASALPLDLGPDLEISKNELNTAKAQLDKNERTREEIIQKIRNLHILQNENLKDGDRKLLSLIQNFQKLARQSEERLEELNKKAQEIENQAIIDRNKKNEAQEKRRQVEKMHEESKRQEEQARKLKAKYEEARKKRIEATAQPEKTMREVNEEVKKTNQKYKEYKQKRTIDVTQVENSIYDLEQMISMNNGDQKFTLSPTVNWSQYKNTSSNNIKSTAHNLQIPVFFDSSLGTLSVAYIYNNIDGNMDTKTFKQDTHTGVLHTQTPKFLFNGSECRVYFFVSYTKGTEEIRAPKNNEGEGSNESESSKSDITDFSMLLGGVGLNVSRNINDALSISGSIGFRGSYLIPTSNYMKLASLEAQKDFSYFVSIHTKYKVDKSMYITPFVSSNVHFQDLSCEFTGGLAAGSTYNSISIDLKGCITQSTNDKLVQSASIKFAIAL